MRKNFLLIAMIILLAAGCKKDRNEITDSQSPQSVIDSPQPENISICTGNNWTTDQNFQGGSYSPTLVYNNKVYVFNNIDADLGAPNVRIFDGTTWTTKPSAIPYKSNWVNFSFVIGNKGYLGFSSESSEFYEYDFAANTWTPKAILPGPRRLYPACFTIGNKGYLVSGYKGGTYIYYDDTWEYNPATDAWTQKANFPLFVFGRARATGFSLANKGYVVNGSFSAPSINTAYLNSVLQYDPTTDTWTVKNNFPGAGRANCQSFVIGGLAYVGAGTGVSNFVFVDYNDFYKYNPITDTWSMIPGFAPLGPFRHSFPINGKGYVTYELFNDPHNILMAKYTPLTCAIPPPSHQ